MRKAAVDAIFLLGAVFTAVIGVLFFFSGLDTLWGPGAVDLVGGLVLIHVARTYFRRQAKS